MSPPIKRKSAPKLPTEAFGNHQLSLFQYFLCNTDEERQQLSNAIDLWDSIPRYSMSRQAMNKLRTPEGFLDSREVCFNYRGTPWTATIHPARIKDEDGKKRDYYPSANEELVEDALRKIATEQQQGYFDKAKYRSGVRFSLYMLRDELKRRGHSRSYHEIFQSLMILAHSKIDIQGDSAGLAVSSYFPELIVVSRKSLESDPEAKWFVQFHFLVTQSIDQLTYRQFNYHQMMSHSTQLARWLHKQLALKFTFASITRSFEMRYSTIRRDSILLNGYAVSRQAIKAVTDALEELKAQNLLMLIEKRDVRGPRGKLEDVIYTLFPSSDFIAAMKASNMRASHIVNMKEVQHEA